MTGKIVKKKIREKLKKRKKRRRLSIEKILMVIMDY
jgi:hypothetical protein